MMSKLIVVAAIAWQATGILLSVMKSAETAKIQHQHVVSEPASIVVSHIVDPLVEDMRRRFARTPLVRHLRELQSDDAPSNNKSFLPYISFFVNSFSDLNRMILPFKDAAADEIKMAINEHCEEDSTHMMLLWKDLEVYSAAMQDAGIGSFASSVEFLWSDQLFATRKLAYEASRLVGSMGEDTPLYRYAMIRVMEEVGNVFFTTGVGYRLPNGVPSRYMSHDHLDLENGHLQQGEQQHDHDGLNDFFRERVFQNEHEKETLIAIMNETYQLFEDMLQAVYTGMEDSALSMNEENYSMA